MTVINFITSSSLLVMPTICANAGFLNANPSTPAVFKTALLYVVPIDILAFLVWHAAHAQGGAMAVGAAQLCLGLLRCASLVAVCREVLALKGFRGTRAFKVTAAAIGWAFACCIISDVTHVVDVTLYGSTFSFAGMATGVGALFRTAIGLCVALWLAHAGLFTSVWPSMGQGLCVLVGGLALVASEACALDNFAPAAARALQLPGRPPAALIASATWSKWANASHTRELVTPALALQGVSAVAAVLVTVLGRPSLA